MATRGYAITHHRRAYFAWQAMKARCGNPKNSSYRHYGARGIVVCERWGRFSNFLSDMGDPPAGMSLDRYPDNDGNYEPSNCRWATMMEQQRNRRSNMSVTYRGTTRPLSEWCELLGRSADYQTIWKRIHRGWSLERALEAPTDIGRQIVINGLSLTADAWSQRLGLHRSTIRKRIDAGWSPERAATTGRVK